MRHIFHDWSDEQSIQGLRHIRQVIPTEGRLLLVELAVPLTNKAGSGKKPM